MTGRKTILDGLPAALVVALAAVVYFGMAKLGLSFSENNEIVSAVWPPAGFGLAATFMLGFRILPGIAVAAFLANVTGESSAGVAAGIAVGNALSFALGAWLLGSVGFNPNLRQVRDVILLALLGAAVGPALNATIGNATLLAAGLVEWSDLWSVWRVWWLGDLTGVLICAPPVLLVLNAWDHHPMALRRVAEGTAWLALLIAVTILLLSESVILIYPVFPLLVLIAIRYRQPGAAAAAVAVTALSIHFTNQGEGPFVGGDPAEDLLAAQLFVALAGLTALMVAAARTEWEASEHTLQDLAESRKALAEAQELAHIGSWEWEIGENRVTWTEELHRIFGVADDGPATTFETYVACIHPDDRERTVAVIQGAVEADRPFHMEHRIIRPDGVERNLECHGRFSYDEQGRQLKMIGTAQDVTNQRSTEQQLSFMATHDPLTGLANRSLFLERLRESLESPADRGELVGVLYCDLDDFKNVNDNLGHETGDQLLAALSTRLQSAVNPRNIVARFGGDEFVVLLERISDQEEALQVARSLAAAFARPIFAAGRTHHISASVGVVFAVPGELSATEVLRDADAAMYRAKASGRGEVSVFDDGLRADLVERIGIENDLGSAASKGQLDVVYQPVYSTGDRTLAGAEALLRWNHPERGLVSPDQFIDVAERVGMIDELGLWVLERACRDAAEWLAKTGRADLTVSVNMSATQVSDSDLAPRIEQVMQQHGIQPGQLALEITESALLEHGPVPIENLKQLRKLGVMLVIDDFGTGYSSLSYLTRIPFDVLKIDQDFVSDLGQRRESEAIVEGILSIASNLDFMVVAEGVETGEQFEWLRSRGCRLVQGFYFTEPLPLTDLIRRSTI